MQKPSIPYPDFPLFAHASGQWAKKIRGKLYYFGVWDNPQAALEKFTIERDGLYAGRGRQTVTTPANYTTVGSLIKSFLAVKESKLGTDDLTETSYKEYVTTCEVIKRNLGDRDVKTLVDTDFANLRQALSRGKGKGKGGVANYSPTTLKRRLTVARMFFKYAGCQPGEALKSPKKSKLREARKARGELLYTSDELRTLVANADPHLKAMILLGINAAFGPQDCELLPATAVSDGWVSFARNKTGIDRKAKLWPETIEALGEIEHSQRVFNGKIWSRHVIAREFKTLCEKCEVRNIGFYSLRRTFETIATTADVSQAVIDNVMGHSRDDMASIYRQRIFDSQIEKCCDHVRQWYLGSLAI